ncbi:S1 family peptidase [Tichowtungia aerotolerans]|uniref:Serine protease n=1 Tax=Tichowtungia aerotolerans TaxID=2697043 RepID=A0A6P1M917_9BACT|nr:serine protease [Tichowtungia aerotolerans]QHI68588.1 hypothetical protein GT409_03695 [Tichowtungia aerotolerans]
MTGRLRLFFLRLASGKEAVRHIRILITLVCLAVFSVYTVGYGNDIKVGDTYQSVIQKRGRPQSKIGVGDDIILWYWGDQIEFKNGRVVRIEKSSTANGTTAHQFIANNFGTSEESGSKAPKPLTRKEEESATDKIILRICLEMSMTGATIGEPEPIEAIIERAKQATVIIEGPDSHGSGVMITSDGYLVTNWHVIASTVNKVRLYDGRVYPINEVLCYSVVSDLAIIKIPNGDFEYMPLGLSSDLSQGDSLYAMGHPHDSEWILTKGYLAANHPRQGKWKPGTLQFSTDISPGSSGGPIFGSDGRVYAIAQRMEFHPIAIKLGIVTDPSRVFRFGITSDEILNLSEQVDGNKKSLVEAQEMAIELMLIDLLPRLFYDARELITQQHKQIKECPVFAPYRRQLGTDRRGNPVWTPLTYRFDPKSGEPIYQSILATEEYADLINNICLLCKPYCSADANNSLGLLSAGLKRKASICKSFLDDYPKEEFKNPPQPPSLNDYSEEIGRAIVCLQRAARKHDRHLPDRQLAEEIQSMTWKSSWEGSSLKR